MALAAPSTEHVFIKVEGQFFLVIIMGTVDCVFGFCFVLLFFYGGRVSSTHCNLRKRMQVDKTQANSENVFINLTKRVKQTLTTEPDRET